MHMRYVGVVLLLFLAGSLHLIGLWFDDNKHHKDTSVRSVRAIGSRIQIILSTPHSIVNTIGETYVFG